ncbi:MAG: hypothetical protein DMF86_12700 [Acidobacteria bacterium]|nr:MAG: hypothetical protein DMF86_12700 [Acidobacteriota bacterium]
MLSCHRGAICRAAIVICFFAQARSAAAQASFVQSAGGNDHYNSASASASLAAAVGAGHAIAVFCGWESLSQTLTSVTDSQGNAYTIVDNPTNGTYGRAAMAYAIARASSADVVSCNFSTASMGKSVLVHEIAGVSSAAPLDGHAISVRLSPGGAANAITSGTITTTAAGDYIVGFTFNDSDNQADWTAGTGYARRQDLQIASYTAASEDRTQASAGAIAATFTATAANFGDFVTGMLAFRAGQVVTPTLVSIAVTPSNPSIAAGTTQPFTAIGTYSDSSTQDVTSSSSWISSNTAVATVNSAGLATAVATGTATIQATLAGVSGSTGLTVTASPPIAVSVSPGTATIQAPSGTRQFTATVANDAQNAGVVWTLTGAGCSGATCGTLSAGSSASGAAITYTAAAAVPSPASVSLTATSITDATRAASADISLVPPGTPTGSTFAETFGDGSAPCWNSGPSTCNQLWVVRSGSAQSIVPTPGAPAPDAAGSQSLRLAEVAGTPGYIYTTGTFPRIPSGTAFDLSFTLDVSSHAMKTLDVTRLITPGGASDGSGYPAQISFRYDGTNLQLQAQGSSTASNVNIALNAWHAVRLHVAPGSGASYVTVDGGPQNAFTANAADFLYLVVGSAAGSADAMTYYVGNLSVDSAIGGGLESSMYIDFEGAADGTTITGAVLAASTHCGNGGWSFTNNPMTGMTISTTAQKSLVSPVTACGTRYTDATGSRGLRYDMSLTDRYAAYNWDTISSSASVGFFYKIGVVDSNWYSVFAITAHGGDYTMLHMHGGAMYLETWAGITNPIPIAANTWYWVTMQYNAGGTHYMQVYETAHWTLLGSASNVSTGNYMPDGIEIGRTGNEPGYPASYWYYDQIVVDYATGAFPILQGSAATLVSLSVTPSNPSIPKGTTRTFSATGTYSDGSTQDVTNVVTWSSSTPSVATISSAGVATGSGVGTTTIQAASGSVSASTSLTVTAPALTSISVTPANPAILVGATQGFTATGVYSDGSTQNLTGAVAWTSSNSSAATIDGGGVATGVGAGSATIRAASGSVNGSTLLTVTSTAPAVVAYVQSASGNDHYSSASASARFAANVTAANAVAVFCVWGGLSTTLTSVTDTQGNVYTVVDNPTTGTYGRAAMAYSIARATGTDTVSCNFSTASAGKSILVHEISGVSASAPLDGHRMTVRNSPGGAANAITSGSITTTASGDYIVGFTFNDSGNQADWNAGTGYTRRQDLRVASYTAASEDRVQASAGAISATFTATSASFGDFITGILAFRPR